MESRNLAAPKIFSYDEARALLPRLRALTHTACRDVAALLEQPGRFDPDRAESAVRSWIDSVHALGATVNGLWLVDFDGGEGFYCWKYPEPDILFYHSYEEGFSERVPIQ